jgi:hypothetical protein
MAFEKPGGDPTLWRSVMRKTASLGFVFSICLVLCGSQEADATTEMSDILWGLDATWPNEIVDFAGTFYTYPGTVGGSVRERLEATLLGWDFQTGAIVLWPGNWVQLRFHQPLFNDPGYDLGVFTWTMEAVNLGLRPSALPSEIVYAIPEPITSDGMPVYTYLYKGQQSQVGVAWFDLTDLGLGAGFGIDSITLFNVSEPGPHDPNVLAFAGNPTFVPEPGSFWLIGSALVCLARFGRRRVV